MNELRESIKTIKRTNNGQIWLSGDFNIPDIDWDLLNIRWSRSALIKTIN